MFIERTSAGCPTAFKRLMSTCSSIWSRLHFDGSKHGQTDCFYGCWRCPSLCQQSRKWICCACGIQKNGISVLELINDEEIRNTLELDLESCSTAPGYCRCGRHLPGLSANPFLQAQTIAMLILDSMPIMAILRHVFSEPTDCCCRGRALSPDQHWAGFPRGDPSVLRKPKSPWQIEHVAIKRTEHSFCKSSALPLNNVQTCS